MTKFKRVISALICVVMLLTMLPAGAFAAEPAAAGTQVIDFTDEAATSGYITHPLADDCQYTDTGLELHASQHAFEQCGGWDQSQGKLGYPGGFTESENPANVVEVPISGENWTATAAFDFATDGAYNAGWYAFFGMFAMQGDDLVTADGVGLRGGDGCFQDWLRKDGELTVDTDKRASNDVSGFKVDTFGAHYWFRLVRDGDKYTAYWSTDGKTFTEDNSISYDATGIDADKIVIDAYSGMGTGFTFTLKSLTIESAPAPTTTTTIDFTDEADQSKYELWSADGVQSAAEYVEDGLKLEATKHAFEGCGGLSEGQQTRPGGFTEEMATTPQDVVIVPVSGDWTATAQVKFENNGDNTAGYYAFFGMYAMKGDDLVTADGVGIRGGDGRFQNWQRIGDTMEVDTDDKSGDRETSGFKTSGSDYWFRIVKSGDTYEAYYSLDGEDFGEKPMCTYEATGIDADKLVIDAYSGMGTGFTFTLKTLTIEGEGGDEPTGPESINFLDTASAKKFTVNEQDETEIMDGQGLYMKVTTESPELTGAQNGYNLPATEKDTVYVDAAGDWTATLKFKYVDNPSDNGWYEYLGFYAWDDWDNYVGTRAGDTKMQVQKAVKGEATNDYQTEALPGGLKSATYHWLRIEKTGTSYKASASADGVTFTEISDYGDLGIKGNKLAIDAYSLAKDHSGLEFYLEYLYFGDDNGAMNQYGVENAAKAIAKSIPAEMAVGAALPTSLNDYTVTYAGGATLSGTAGSKVTVNGTVTGAGGKTATFTKQVTLTASGAKEGKAIYEDDSGEYSYEERAADLVARMSVSQKGSQIVERASAIPAASLGLGADGTKATVAIKGYDWWSEALHGYSDADAVNGNSCNNSTSYPTNEAVGSSWNPELYYNEAVQIGQEIRERTTKNDLGNSVSLNMYSPTVNMHRDPRWGRNEESFSEDPLLMGAMASQFVNGLEGKDQNGELIEKGPAGDGLYQAHATIKHYLANTTENIRLNGGAEFTLRELYEYYAAPYRTVIEDAHVTSVMTAYSTVNGEPSSYSSFLMDTLLRQTFGLTGHITSDCDSVATMSRLNHTNPYTGKTLTTLEQFANALAHGEDLECIHGHDGNDNTSYATMAQRMIDEAPENDKGVFTENTLDIAVHRLMTARLNAGEFDTDNAYSTAAAARVTAQQAEDSTSPASNVYWQTAERIKLAEQMADETIVMLKNDGNILPLTKASGDNIVLVGSWMTNMNLGIYTSFQQQTPNHVNLQKGITDAIKAVNPDATVTAITTNTLTAANEQTIKDADVVIVAVGTEAGYSRENGDRSSIALPNGLDNFIAQVGDLNENTIAIMETCGPMQVSKFEGKVKALLWSSFNGIRKGVGYGDVISGKVSPSGHLTDTWYVSDAEIPSIMDYNLYATDGSKGRTYMYYTGTPQYPFGYGLSYTTFKYDNLKIDKTDYTANDTVTVTFDVTNTGKVKSKEVAQLYIAQPDAKKELNRPIRRLEGFEKIELAPGEKKTVTMKVAIPDLAYFNEAEDVMAFQVDTGKYQVQVGEDSAHATLTADFNVTGKMDVYPKLLTVKAAAKGDGDLGVEQRLIYNKGMEIEPKLTVAMNDESLHGYVIAHQNSPIRNVKSSPLPEGMTFTYSSNRPDVVQASADGKSIKAVGVGVATVTITGKLGNHTVETHFVAYVKASAAIDGITVGDEPLEGFDRDKFNYELTGYDTVPQVNYVSNNADLEIKVEQAKAVPGVATITSFCPDNNETRVYRIGFGKPPVSANFSDASKWTILNPDAANAKVDADGKLTITAGAGAFGPDAKNVYMQTASGDWVAQTHLTLAAALTGSGQEAGMTVYDYADNYIRYGYTNGGRLNVYLAGSNSAAATATVSGSPTDLYLQVVKQGGKFQFNYSTDGTTWAAVGSGINCAMALPQVGVYAVAGTRDAFGATFDGINVSDVAELYPRLKTITVDGKELTGFDSETFVYNQEVETGAAAPKITAEPATKGHTVTIEPETMTSAYGTVTITVSSEVASQTYKIAFNHAPVDDYFADGDYDKDNWTILKEADTDLAYHHEEVGKGIVMPTQPGDIYGTGGDWHNLFVTPAMGTWEVVTKVLYPQVPTGTYQQAMMVIWQDEDNYIRLNCQEDRLFTEAGMETNGSFTGNLGSTTLRAAEDGTVTIYYKIRKTGNEYALAISQNGLDWTDLQTAKDVQYTDPKIGLFVTENSSNAPIEMYFEYMYATDRNGVQHGDEGYRAMLNWAAQNVADYVAAGLPATTKDNLTFAAIPHGYTMTVSSDHPEIIDADGKVTQPATGTNVNVTVTVKGTDGDVTATATKVIGVTGTGGDTPEPPTVDKTALKAAIADAASKKADDYTADSFKTMTDALAEARTVDAKADATQAEVNAAEKKLTDAVKALVPAGGDEPPTVSKDALKKAISDAESKKADDYTADSFKAMTDALAKAKAVDAKADATQTEVDDATTALNDAIKALVPAGDEPPAPADKTALNKAIADAEALKADDYTADSYKAVTDALAEAKTVAAKADATQAEVDAAAKALTDAIKALAPKGDEPGHECPSEQFTDLEKDPEFWYHDGIDYMVEKGYMNGTDATTFKPLANIKRGDLVQILYRIAGEPDVSKLSNPFQDIQKDYYKNAITWAADKKIVTGKSDTKFAPEEAITREQLAAILYRWSKAKAPADDKLAKFPDGDKVQSYAKDAMNWAVDQGIITGIEHKDTGTTTLSPQGSATRAQIAVMLERYLNK